MALTLTTDERTELDRRVRSLKIRAEDARRARVILMLANEVRRRAGGYYYLMFCRTMRAEVSITMGRQALAVVAATLTLSTSGCGEDPGAGPSALGDGPTVTVTGTVSDRGSTPLPDALVELMNGPLAGGVVTTGADGRFSIPGIAAGVITLRASKPDYSTATQTAIVVREPLPFKFSLEPFRPVAVNVTGRVTDGDDRGVSDARVGINSPVPAWTTSDGAGTYGLSLTLRPPDPTRPSAWWGPVAVLAERAGYEPDQRYATLAVRTPVDFRLHPVVRLSPGATARLAIENGDPECYEVSFSSESSWPCRTVRITPVQTGTLMLELEWDTEAAVLGLQVRGGNGGWRCCQPQQSARVAAGTELLVDVVLINGRPNRPPPSGSISFVLKTSMTQE